MSKTKGKNTANRVDKPTSMTKETPKNPTGSTNVKTGSNDKKENTLQDMINETNILKGKYNSLEDAYLAEQNEMLSQIEEVSSNLGAKSEELALLSKRNKKLFENLKGIKEEVDFQMKSIKIFNVKQQELEDAITSLNNQIKARDNQINTYKKILATEQKQNQRLQTILNENKNGSNLANLEKELASLQEEEKRIKNEEMGYKSISKHHKDCENKIKQLQKKIEVLNNEYAFYQKKQEQKNAINTNQSITLNQNTIQKLVKSPSTKEQNKKIYLTETSEAKGRGKSRQSPKKEFVVKKRACMIESEKLRAFQKSISPLWDELSSVNRSVQMKKNNFYQQTFAKKSHRNHSLSSIEESTRDKLFLPEEKKVLEKLIPSNQLTNLEQKFKEMDNEKKKIKQQLITESSKINRQIKDNKIKFEELSKEIKKVKEKKITLRNIASKQNGEIASLTSKINNIKKTITFFSGQYKQKMQEYDFLNNHIQSLYEQIDSGKLIKKDQPQIEKTEDNYDIGNNGDNGDNPENFENGENGDIEVEDM